MSWSTGKDSAYALHKLLQDDEYHVSGLFTTINNSFNRVAMHSTRETLLEMQAQKLGLPLTKVTIPFPCTNTIYEEQIEKLIHSAKIVGVECIAFGDLFLEDIRAYREKQLEGTGIQPIFPIWGLETKQLAKEMINEGFRAVITCIDPKQINANCSGQKFDEEFLKLLPETADHCGENGEFHTFVYDGPIFSSEILINVGNRVERDGFVFSDIFEAQ